MGPGSTLLLPVSDAVAQRNVQCLLAMLLAPKPALLVACGTGLLGL